MVATPELPAAPVGATPGAPAATPDPQGDLKKLKDQQQKVQAQLDQLTQTMASIRQEISPLETALAEIDQTVKTYTQGAAPIADQSLIQTFVAQQMNGVLGTIGASGKSELDAITGKIDSDIQNQTQAIPGLQTTSDQAATAQAFATKTLSDKQSTYDTTKGTLARAQAAVADLKNLKTLVSSAADAGKFGTMYVLLGEMTAGLTSASQNLPKPADLQTQLTAALSDLHLALNDARDKKQAADAAADALATAKKKLSDTKSARRSALLDAVKDWKPKPAAAAAPDSPASPATPATTPAMVAPGRS